MGELLSLLSCALILSSFFHPSSQNWNMSELTLEVSTTERDPTMEELLLERNSKKSISLGITVSSDAAISLCMQMTDDIDHSGNLPKFAYIDITRNEGTFGPEDNSLDINCLKWVLQPCEGTASGGFDPDCSFWVPLKDTSYPGCSDESKSLDTFEVRRRRSVLHENILLNGLDSAALCAALQLVETNGIFETVTLKTDEASGFRCTNWEFQDIMWTKTAVSKEECDKMNKYRNVDLISDQFYETRHDDQIQCLSNVGIPTCTFSQT